MAGITNSGSSPDPIDLTVEYAELASVNAPIEISHNTTASDYVQKLAGNIKLGTTNTSNPNFAQILAQKAHLKATSNANPNNTDPSAKIQTFLAERRANPKLPLDENDPDEDQDAIDKRKADEEMIERYFKDHDMDPVPLQELRTGVCYDPRMRFHMELMSTEFDFNFHPEDPRRILAIFKILCENGLIDGAYPTKTRLAGKPLLWIASQYATRDECSRAHTEDHYDWLQTTANMDDAELIQHTKSSDSAYFNQSTFAAALLAAGSAIATTRAVVEGSVKNAFAIIRPPGHHAEPPRSSGFCHFDNIAVAALDALELYPDKIKKILVVDWDVHHGNGIQKIFESDPRVLFISMHVHMHGTFYPSGDYGGIKSDGEGAGKGFSINIPWEKQGMVDGDYLMAFRHIIMPVAQEFNPDLVMIASGFDAADGDQLGGCHVTPSCYAHMTHQLMSLAGGRVVACLEGGYNLTSISVSALAVTKTLMGEAPPPIVDSQPSRLGPRTIFEVIDHQHQYWQSLYPKNNAIQTEFRKYAERLHDLIRDAQADLFFRQFRMFNVPILRADGSTSRSFSNQILATSKFREARQLLLIFHDSPQIDSGLNPVTGETSLADTFYVDPAPRFIEWGIDKKFGIIDINVPELYTGLSLNMEMWNPEIHKQNRRIWLHHLDQLCTDLWQRYIKVSSAKNIVILGLGDAFIAAQRIFRSQTWEEFEARPTKAVGVTHKRIPDAVPQAEASLERFDECYFKWTTVWAKADERPFKELRNGRTKKRYGNCQKSDVEGYIPMINRHEQELKNKILEGFGLPLESSSTSDAGDASGGAAPVVGLSRKRSNSDAAPGDAQRSSSRRRLSGGNH